MGILLMKIKRLGFLKNTGSAAQDTDMRRRTDMVRRQISRTRNNGGGGISGNFFTKGFTLIETLIGSAIFLIISAGIYFSYSNVLDLITSARFNSNAMAIMQSQAELIRNMKYEDVGIQNGSPPGKLLAVQNVTVDATTVTLSTYVRNIDDSFDGTIGGAPNDLSPADYKIVEMQISCGVCRFSPPKFTTTIAPKNLEGASNNGSLFIGAIDASGQPVTGADVTVLNTKVSPNISLNDVTNISGELQMVDTATSSVGYEITISKPGYSADKTYLPGATPNPNPLKPHATVAKQQLTRITLSIDRLSTLALKTQDQYCQAVPAVDFAQTGSKLIGTNPDILKVSRTLATDGTGDWSDPGTEWDTYTFTNTDTAYQISGENFSSPLTVNPNTSKNLVWTVEPKSPQALLVSVQTAAGVSIPDATVTLTKSGFSASAFSGRRTFGQTDWSAGAYDAKSANIDESTVPGQLTIVSVAGKYATQSDEWLISKTYDLGTTTTVFNNLSFNPASQPPPAGTDSLKFQVAGNTDNATWNFTGPDGTAGSYYTNPAGTVLWSGLNGSRYIRYKAILRTESSATTPTLQDISIDFSSICIPSDQTIFSGLANGTYTLTVTKNGYQPFTDAAVVISAPWRDYHVILVP